jgi:hypothetical protein
MMHGQQNIQLFIKYIMLMLYVVNICKMQATQSFKILAAGLLDLPYYLRR